MFKCVCVTFLLISYLVQLLNLKVYFISSSQYLFLIISLHFITRILPVSLLWKSYLTFVSNLFLYFSGLLTSLPYLSLFFCSVFMVVLATAVSLLLANTSLCFIIYVYCYNNVLAYIYYAYIVHTYSIAIIMYWYL